MIPVREPERNITDIIKDNMIFSEHLKRWSPNVRKYGIQGHINDISPAVLSKLPCHEVPEKTSKHITYNNSRQTVQYMIFKTTSDDTGGNFL